MDKVFDFKKEYKDLYSASLIPSIVDVKKARFIAIQGKGNPNDIDGEYKKALNVLYSIAYTLKMSYKMDYKINGYYKYIVPPLEGFWWQDNSENLDINNKNSFNWISVIRLPNFITKEDFDWAVKTATIKKNRLF